MHSRADAPKSNPTCTILNFFSLKLKRLRLLWTEISRDREISCKKREMSFESHWEEHVSLADGNKWRPTIDTISQPFFFSLRPSLLSFLPLICIISLFRSPRVALRKEGRLSILTPSHSPVHWKPILALGILFNTYNYCITAFWLLQLVERRSA